MLDDVRIYNAALSADEILALYNEAGAPPSLTSITLDPQSDSEDLPRMIESLKSEKEDCAIQLFELATVWRK